MTRKLTLTSGMREATADIHCGMRKHIYTRLHSVCQVKLMTNCVTVVVSIKLQLSKWGKLSPCCSQNKNSNKVICCEYIFDNICFSVLLLTLFTKK